MPAVITAATDGSALGNPGPAGWAWVIDKQNWRVGGWQHATNNQAELMAVLDLLRATENAAGELVIQSDSKYVIDSLTKWMPGWKKKGWRKADGKPVLNVELMQELDRALTGRKVTFEWIKGHSGHLLNETADTLAVETANSFRVHGTATNAGPGFNL
ncbi:ribonuclease HI [Canibacter sp. lx-72]|uniref:ribonuclease H family protein n=1 Tax=Canibacter zhuwentaonis TaxID=2837491 RepID=UPI001BDCE5C8|nr:ribonuclease HI [Canibacter zhuwentaonis]MBT1034840.1 ribonuclease HI [Canibacter zhuwentaonis]